MEWLIRKNRLPIKYQKKDRRKGKAKTKWKQKLENDFNN